MSHLRNKKRPIKQHNTAKQARTAHTWIATSCPQSCTGVCKSYFGAGWVRNRWVCACAVKRTLIAMATKQKSSKPVPAQRCPRKLDRPSPAPLLSSLPRRRHFTEASGKALRLYFVTPSKWTKKKKKRTGVEDSIFNSPPRVPTNALPPSNTGTPLLRLPVYRKRTQRELVLF